MSEQPEDFLHSLQALKLVYASSLPQKIEELEKAMDESLQAVAELSHKLAGTAGMYGFLAVSEIAGDLERLCDLILTRGTDPGEDDLLKIAAMIDSLQQQASQDCAEAAAVVDPDEESP